MSAACEDGIRPGRCRVPDKEELRLAIGHEPEDRRGVRPPGLDEPFEELTVSELVQLRPESEPAVAYVGDIHR